MEIKGKIAKIGFLTGTFNILKEYIPKSIAKEEWADALPMDKKIMQSEHFGEVERERYLYSNTNKDEI